MGIMTCQVSIWRHTLVIHQVAPTYVVIENNDFTVSTSIKIVNCSVIKYICVYGSVEYAKIFKVH